jgi:hypothetical protein
MFDVFYIGTKSPGLFSHERAADSIQHAQSLSRTRYFWIVNYLCDYTGWDFLWEPPPWQSHQRHAWASQWQKDSGTYLVPKSGYQDTNYHDAPVLLRLPDQSLWHIPYGLANTFDYSWHPDPTEPPMTYQFGTQWQKTGGPIYINGGTTVKYIAEPRCTKHSVDSNWDIPPGTDPSSFDWTWHPDATEQNYIYQFGTQHQRTGGPRYVTAGATDIKFVDQLRIRSQRVATAIIEIDHLDGNAGQIPNVTKTSRYFDNYLDTLKRIAKNIGQDHEFVWICSSICDYTDFDFSWHPEQWQATMLHVFPSNGEKFGDTFFMHVPTFQYRADTCQLLEWYDLNFVDGISVPRRAMPMITHSGDSQVDAVKTQNWAGPLALFTVQPNVSATGIAVPLWREKTRVIVPLSDGASSVIVPRSAVPWIQTQLYDYPHIDRTKKMLLDDPLDIVFISNGEPGADHHWDTLNQMVSERKNRLHRVDGVNGRVAAYHAAAQASQTPWFFAVFAKLQVDQDFDWSWQPDRLQQAKHYIFQAKNPVNDLVYGHQAMIAYNTALCLANTGQGLDFTLDDPHESVDRLSGTAQFNTDPWATWRTAFREVLKLRHDGTSIDSRHRLKIWLTRAQGAHAEWCLRGAQDAVAYYDAVKGNFDQLKLSYEWAWLKEYFDSLHTV